MRMTAGGGLGWGGGGGGGGLVLGLGEALTWKVLCDRKVNLSVSNRPWLVCRNTE